MALPKEEITVLKEITILAEEALKKIDEAKKNANRLKEKIDPKEAPTLLAFLDSAINKFEKLPQQFTKFFGRKIYDPKETIVTIKDILKDLEDLLAHYFPPLMNDVYALDAITDDISLKIYGRKI